MSAVVPYGDPDLMGLRGELLPAAPGQPDGLLDLGGSFGMHPSLTNVDRMYKAGEVLLVHAVAGPYRVRSHLEAQDYMESGADHRLTSGWLNRAIATMPAASANRPEGNALAIGVAVPVLLGGPATIGNWAPHGNFEAPASLYQEIAALNQPDHVTGPAIAEGLRGRRFSTSVMTGDEDPDPPHALRLSGLGARRTSCCARQTDRVSPRWKSPAGTRTSRKRHGSTEC